jgi:hypothetical protein
MPPCSARVRGTARGLSESIVAVGIFERALPPSKAFFVDCERTARAYADGATTCYHQPAEEDANGRERHLPEEREVPAR